MNAAFVKAATIQLSGSPEVRGVLAETPPFFSLRYLQSTEPAISPSLPQPPDQHLAPELFPYFDNLAPEGPNAAMVAGIYGIDPNQRFDLLLATGRDLSGHCQLLSNYYPPLPPIDLHERRLETPPSVPFCLATLEPLSGDRQFYSPQAQNELGLAPLGYLPFARSDIPALDRAAVGEQQALAGMQPKFSGSVLINGNLSNYAVFNRAIVKTPNPENPAIILNEHLTMLLARRTEIPTANSFLMPMADGAFALVVVRFDRTPDGRRLPCEDFCQVLQMPAAKKYDFDLTNIRDGLRYSSSPTTDANRLFDQIIFSLYCGNSDAHLKNYSVVSDKQTWRLSPAYDLVNTSLFGRVDEQTALPLAGVANNLTNTHIYRLAEAMTVDASKAREICSRIASHHKLHLELIARSCMSPHHKALYARTLEKSMVKLKLTKESTMTAVRRKHK